MFSVITSAKEVMFLPFLCLSVCRITQSCYRILMNIFWMARICVYDWILVVIRITLQIQELFKGIFIFTFEEVVDELV